MIRAQARKYADRVMASIRACQDTHVVSHVHHWQMREAVEHAYKRGYEEASRLANKLNDRL